MPGWPAPLPDGDDGKVSAQLREWFMTWGGCSPEAAERHANHFQEHGTFRTDDPAMQETLDQASERLDRMHVEAAADLEARLRSIGFVLDVLPQLRAERTRQVLPGLDFWTISGLIDEVARLRRGKDEDDPAPHNALTTMMGWLFNLRSSAADEAG